MQDIKSYELDPNFAVVYSFLKTFGKHFGEEYENITLKEFKDFLEAKSVEPSNILVRLHGRCLRGIGNCVKNQDWQPAIIKFCKDFPDGDDKLLKKNGYFDVPVEVKLRILKNLCEDQFEFNDTFNKRVNQSLEEGKDADCLRENLLGRDRLGRSYWLHLDHEGSVHVYRSWRNELTDEETWKLVCEDRDGMQELLETLHDADDLVQDDPHLCEGKSGENTANITTDHTGPDDVAEILYWSQLSKHAQFYRVPKPRGLEQIRCEEKQHHLNHCSVKLERLKDSVCCSAEKTSIVSTEESAVTESQTLYAEEQKCSKPNKIVDEKSKDLVNEKPSLKGLNIPAIGDGDSSVTQDIKQTTAIDTDNIVKSQCVDEGKVKVEDKKETKSPVKKWTLHSTENTPKKSAGKTEDNGKNVFKDCVVKLEELAYDSKKDILPRSKCKEENQVISHDIKTKACVVELEEMGSYLNGTKVGKKCGNDAQDKDDNKTDDDTNTVTKVSVEVGKPRHKNQVNTLKSETLVSKPDTDWLKPCRVTLEKLSPDNIKKATEISHIDESSSSSSCFSAGFEELSENEMPQDSVNSVEDSASKTEGSSSRTEDTISRSNSVHSEEGFEEISETEIEECKTQSNETGEEFKTQRNETGEEFKTQSNETGEEFKTKRNETGEEFKTQSNETGEEFKTKRNETGVEFKTQSNETGEEFKTQSNETGEEFKTQRNETGEEFKTQRNETGEEFKTQRNETGVEFKTQSNETCEEFKTKRNETGEEFKTQRNETGEEFKTKRNETGEEFKTQSNETGEEFKTKSIETGEEFKTKSIETCDEEFKPQSNETCDIKSSDMKVENSLSDRNSKGPTDNTNTSMDIDKQNIDNALKDLLSLEEIIKHGKEFDHQECKCSPKSSLGSKTSCETCQQSVNSAASKEQAAKAEAVAESSGNLDNLIPNNVTSGSGFTDHSIDKLCMEKTNVPVVEESIKSPDETTVPDVKKTNAYSVFMLKPTGTDKVILEPTLLRPIKKDKLPKDESFLKSEHCSIDIKHKLKSKLKSSGLKSNQDIAIDMKLEEMVRNYSYVNTDMSGDKGDKIDVVNNTQMKGEKIVVNMNVDGEDIYIEENQDENDDADIDVVNNGSDCEKVVHLVKSDTDTGDSDVEVVSVDFKSEKKRKKQLYKASDRKQKLRKNQRDLMIPSVGSSVSKTPSFTNIPITASTVSPTSSTSSRTPHKVLKFLSPGALPVAHSNTSTKSNNTEPKFVKIIHMASSSPGHTLSQSEIQAALAGSQLPGSKPSPSVFVIRAPSTAPLAGSQLRQSRPVVMVRPPTTSAGIFVPVNNVSSHNKPLFMEKSLLSKPNLIITNTLNGPPPTLFRMPTSMLSAGSSVLTPANISNLLAQPMVHNIMSKPVISSLTSTVTAPTMSNLLGTGPLSTASKYPPYISLQTGKMIESTSQTENTTKKYKTQKSSQKSSQAHPSKSHSSDLDLLSRKYKKVKSKLAAENPKKEKKYKSKKDLQTGPSKNHPPGGTLQSDKLVKSKYKAESSKKKRKAVKGVKGQIGELSESSDSDKDLVIEDVETDHEEEEEDTDSDYDYETISRRVRAATRGEVSKGTSEPQDEDKNKSDSEEIEVLEERTVPLEFGRNAKLTANTMGLFCLDEHSEDEGDPKTACSVCGKGDHLASLLICDMCDSCYHLACLSPPLLLVPLGDWQCPECDHEKLIVRLKYQFEKVKKYLYRNKRTERFKSHKEGTDWTSSSDRVTLNMFKITEANILTKRSSRSHKEVNYSYSNYDKMVKQAVKNGLNSSSESEAEAERKNETTKDRKPTSKPRMVKKDTSPVPEKSRKVKHKNTRSKSKAGPTAAKKQKLTSLKESENSEEDESDYNCSDFSVSSEDYAEPEEDRTVEKPRGPDNDTYYTVSGRKTNSMSRVSKYL